MQDAGSLTSPRARRGLIAVLVLLLILLPLYLWPVRGGSGRLPDAAALSGAVADPRSAAAVARIPADVWDALTRYAKTPPPLPPKPRPRNLTMITRIEGAGGLDEGADPWALASGIHAPPDLSSGELSGGDPGDVGSPAAPTQFLAESPQGGAGTGTPSGAFAPGRHADPNLGPWPGGTSGGGPRLSSPGPTLDPGGPVDLAPTPEPATLVLLVSNLALVGAAAWRRRRRWLETTRGG